jgi:hypothetical protein
MSKAPEGKELNDYMGDGDWFVPFSFLAPLSSPSTSVCSLNGASRFKIDIKPASDGLHWDYNSDAQINIVRLLLISFPSRMPLSEHI